MAYISGLFDAKFPHAGTQGTAVKTQNLGCAVLSADLPLGLFQHADNVVAFYGFQSFLVFAQISKRCSHCQMIIISDGNQFSK